MDAWPSQPRDHGEHAGPDAGAPLFPPGRGDDTLDPLGGPRPPLGFPLYREGAMGGAPPPPPPPPPPHFGAGSAPPPMFEMHLSDVPSPFGGGGVGLGFGGGLTSTESGSAAFGGADEFAFGASQAFPPLLHARPPPPPPHPAGSPLYHLQYQQHLHRQQQQQQQQQQQRQFLQPPPAGELSMRSSMEFGSLDDGLHRPSPIGFLGSQQPPSPSSSSDAFDLSSAMRELNVTGAIGSGPRSASPGRASSSIGSWDAAHSSSLRDQMNQQMAALYQQSQAPERSAPTSQSMLSFQSQSQPLAPSGGDLLSSLMHPHDSSGRYEAQHFSMRASSPSGAAPSPLSLSFPPLDSSGAFPTMAPMSGGGGYHLHPPPLHMGGGPALTPSRTRRSPAKSPPSHHFRPMRERDARTPGVSAVGGELPAGNAVGVTPDVTKPNDNIKVQISLKAEECTPGRVLMVGLFRLGQLSNEKPIFVKQVLFENKLNRNYRFLNTRITFRSPRSPGEFEFRVFEDKKGGGGDHSSGSSTPKRHQHQHGGHGGDDHHGDANGNGNGYSNFTIARSNRLKVCMEYNHFIDTLRATNDKFNQARNDGDAGAVLSALLSLLRLIDQVETVFLHGHALFGDLLDVCLRLVAMRAGDVRDRFAPTDTIPNPMETFHGTMRNVLNAIQCNAFVRELVSDELLAEIEFFQRELYCQVSGLYFPSQEARHAFWKQHFGFEPVELPPHSPDAEGSSDDAWLRAPFVTAALTSFLTREAERLIPERERFVSRRQKIFDQLRSEVLATLSFRVDLDVFGSSANDFGSDGSDMDMCLVLPAGAAASVEHKQEMLLEVVRRLEARPDLFTAIDASRLTARIPIVMFTSTEFGIECDLCVENALALRNTALLRAYANADRRVRVLAYTLKQFVKRRRMNCAAEGTLSSYGYLLMLIHYLQRQSPPVLPVLQSLPSDWDGNSACECTATSVKCPPRSPRCRLSERMVEMRLPSVLCKGPGGELDPTSADATVGIETYFFDPFAAAGSGEDAQAVVAKKLEALRAFAGRNDKTVGELWLGFLRYFGLEFDASRQVVSVRMARALSKEEKKRAHQWRMHTRLSIEDPFEASYDVAHVLKGSRDKYIRQQFVRAYSLVMRQVVQRDAAADKAALEGDGAADGSAWREAERVMLAVNEQVVDVPFLHPHGLAAGHPAANGLTGGANSLLMDLGGAPLHDE